MFAVKVKTIPLLKKIVSISGTKALILPAVWLKYCKARYGCEIKQVLLREVDQSLVITPVPPTKAPEAQK